MTRLSDNALALLASDAFGHVTTVDADGAPYTTLAWVGLEEDEIVFATLHDQRKLANIRRDPRVTISIVSDDSNEFGLREYMVVYGTGRVTEGGAPELLQELAYTYIAPGVEFPPMPDPPPGFVTRVSIDKVSGIGSWKA